MRKKLFIIDGHALIYRAFYALPILSNSKGQITNAILGFTNTFWKILKEENPDFLAVTFDFPAPNYRHKQYPLYKANRRKMPEELRNQIPFIKTIIKSFNVPVLEKEGYEADDLMGGVAKKGEKDYEIILFTPDKDILQLISPYVKVMVPAKGFSKETLIYDEREVQKRWGVKPTQIPDLIGLAGDSSDNIPGVPGIGEKTAAALIQKFESLEKLLDNIDKVKGKKQQDNLRKFSPQAVLSKELATIRKELPFNFDFKEYKKEEVDYKKLAQIFQELGFHRLLKEIIPPSENHKVKYQMISKKEELEILWKKLRSTAGFGLSLITTESNPFVAKIIGMAISLMPAENFYLPLKQLDEVLKGLKPILEDEKIEKYGYNFKYEIMVLKRYGIELKGIIFDVMIADYLLNPAKSTYNLEEISLEHLNYRMSSAKKTDAYACEEANIIFHLKEVLSIKLKKENLEKLFFALEMPLVDVLAQMELKGIKINLKHLREFSKWIKKEIDRLTQEIYHLTGEEFNLNSPQQISFFLFEKFQLPRGRKIKTGYSTDMELLENLSMYELPRKILEYRQLTKLKSTYIDALSQMVNPQTERIHTSFNQTGTATGRLSSSNPNLQNIPVKTEMGREIRKTFIPEGRDFIFLSADYSQIELRLLAHFSGDANLQSAFSGDEDIHLRTAQEIFEVLPQTITADLRRIAKTVNFGIIYGMSVYGLAKELKISRKESQKFINKYFEKYKEVKEYIERSIKEVCEKGYTTTLLGRRRYLPNIKSKNDNLRQFAERIAVNTPLQGSAADLIKIAMVKISYELKRKKMKTIMVLQVHDDLLFEVPKKELEETKVLIKKTMTEVFPLNVLLKVDLKIGENWFQVLE